MRGFGGKAPARAAVQLDHFLTLRRTFAMLNRAEALELIKAQGPEPHLIQHALASEAVLRALAARLGEDEDLWAMAGLLHDIDYPLTADNMADHGYVGADMLAGKAPDAVCRAIRAHNPRPGDAESAPATPLDFALRCGETVTGLISAAALVRPTGLDGMQASSLKKKMKDKAFAASVCRETIKECDRLGLELTEFLDLAIAAMSSMDEDAGEGKP